MVEEPFIPYFVGPSDPAALRDYLNQLCRGLNQIYIWLNPATSPVNASLSPYQMQASDALLLIDASAGNVTVNLVPAAPYLFPVLSVKRIDQTANTVTLVPAGADKIDGGASLFLSLYDVAFGLRPIGSPGWLIF